MAELFAGVGGFAVGLDALGGRRVFACEIEGQARGCYEANFGFPLARDVRDVKGVDVSEHELLTAGFPCQPFSREGTQPGLEHRLGLLFAEIVRLLVASRPAMFLLENVPRCCIVAWAKFWRHQAAWRATPARCPQNNGQSGCAWHRRGCGWRSSNSRCLR